MIRLRLITRIALFSALIYVLSWATAYFPNLNLIFFIVFTAGFLWGVVSGVVVGGVGMALWTTFNPYGIAMPPIMLAQIIGAGGGGFVGAFFAKTNWKNANRFKRVSSLAVCAVLCSVIFYLPVNIVDAWVFQPFWPRFYAGLLWMLISLVSNCIIFPLLFPVAELLYDRESAV